MLFVQIYTKGDTKRCAMPGRAIEEREKKICFAIVIEKNPCKME